MTRITEISSASRGVGAMAWSKTIAGGSSGVALGGKRCADRAYYESIERDLFARFKRSDLVADLRHVDELLPEVRAWTNHVFSRLEEDLPEKLPCVEALRWRDMSSPKVLVPAIFFGNQTNVKLRADYFDSTGSAIGRDIAMAVDAAYLEYIERQVIASLWRTGLKPSWVDEHSSMPYPSTRLLSSSGKLNCLGFTLSGDLHVVIALWYGAQGNGVQYAVGAKAHHSKDGAMKGAIDECFQALIGMFFNVELNDITGYELDHIQQNYTEANGTAKIEDWLAAVDIGTNLDLDTIQDSMIVHCFESTVAGEHICYARVFSPFGYFGFADCLETPLACVTSGDHFNSSPIPFG